MESITSLIRQLQGAKLATPEGKTISYQKGNGFRWDPKSLCIFYNPADALAPQLLLHELGHALLGHSDYSHDIKLIEIERAAWEKAVAFSTEYGIDISEDTVEDHLDTYRDWLHARSLCPSCSTTGLQTASNGYTCPSCHTSWRVNQAKTCGLKRYKTK